MTSGKIPNRRTERLGLFGAILLLLWLPLQSLAAQPDDLSELMGRLAKTGSLYARYSERIDASVLQRSINSRGTIRYRAPDKIVKSTDGEPRREVQIEGDRIWVRQGDESREIHIGEHRAIDAMVSAMRSLLAGDLDDLQRHFHVRFEPAATKDTDGGWELTLEPRSTEVSWLLSRIQIRGTEAEVREIELQEPNGDSRRMRIHHQEIDPPQE